MSKKQKGRPVAKSFSRKSRPPIVVAPSASSTLSTASTEVRVVDGENNKPIYEELTAWLKEQATKLKTLQSKGNRLKLDFVQNARDQGKILLEVHERLTGTSVRFEKWVSENTDIGCSTALLWMDVARHYEDVMKQFVDSNPLELTVRQIRDAIRDARQRRGEGKPGSGKRKAVATTKPLNRDTEETDDPTDLSDQGRWERETSKAEAEAAEVEGEDKSEVKVPLYKLTAIVFSESDQSAIYESLLNWSPTSSNSLGSKSIILHARTTDIGTLLTKLGKTLEQSQPEKVRVSIEL
jgi:hypothetical protein